MNLPTMPSIKNIALLIAFPIACVALAGCGNKGPLVKPSDIPAAAPAATPEKVDPATEPDATPAPQPVSGTPAARR